MSLRDLRAVLPLLTLVALVGCRTPMSAELGQVLDRDLPDLGRSEEVQTAVGPVSLEYRAGDEASAEAMRAALLKVGPEVARWGKLDAPLRLLLVTHDELEWLTGRHGYPWLRAWARHDDLLFQSPSTFPIRPPTARELEEMVEHELTHSVMFQQAATTTSWRHKQIPFWFREGMATVTAEQGYRYPALEDIAQFYRARAGLDPISAPEALWQGDAQIVYASAHHAFTFFTRRYGEDAVNGLLQRMSDGANFGDAFKAEVGITPNAFLRDFKRFIQWGGYKSGPRVRRSAGSEERSAP